MKVSTLLTLCLFFCKTFLLCGQTHVHVFKTREDIGGYAGSIVKKYSELTQAKDREFLLVLPPSQTADPLFSSLLNMWKDHQLDLSKIKIFQLYCKLEENSNQYLRQHFLDLACDKLTIEKIDTFLEKTCLSQKIQNSQKLKKAFTEIKQILVSEVNLRKPKDFSELENIYSKSTKSLRHIMPEFFEGSLSKDHHNFLENIYLDITLWPKGLKEKNIYQPNLTVDLTQAAKEYRETYLTLQKSKPFTQIFLDHAKSSAYLGGINFTSDEGINRTEYDLDKKNNLSLESSIKFVRRKDKEGFENIICLGLTEILDASDILVIGYGPFSRKSLYNGLSSLNVNYQIPASFLRKAKICRPCYLVDELAYGNKAQSKANLRSFYQSSLKKNNDLINIYYHNVDAIAFDKIPDRNQPAMTLNPCSEALGDSVQLTFLPKNQRVLFLKKRKSNQLHLLELLKLKNNKLFEKPFGKLKEIVKHICQTQPDLLFLPSDICSLPNFKAQLKKALEEQNYQKPILGVLYRNKRYSDDCILPLSKELLVKKIEALESYHLSQTRSSPYKSLVEYLATYYDFKKERKLCPNESFEVFKIKKTQKGLAYHKIRKSIISSMTPQAIKRFSNFVIDDSFHVVCVAPHPDDVEIGMGGLLHTLNTSKISPVVLNATTDHNVTIYRQDLIDGKFLENFVPEHETVSFQEEITDKEYKTMIREFETLNALKFLNPLTQVENLRLPLHNEETLTPTDEKKAYHTFVRHLLSKDGKIIVFLPRPDDFHPSHTRTTKLFKKYLETFINEEEGDQEIYLAYYRTPWSGKWNLYHYNFHKGNKLAALVGADILKKIRKRPIPLNLLGGNLAERFYVFHVLKSGKS